MSHFTFVACWTHLGWLLTWNIDHCNCYSPDGAAVVAIRTTSAFSSTETFTRLCAVTSRSNSSLTARTSPSSSSKFFWIFLFFKKGNEWMKKCYLTPAARAHSFRPISTTDSGPNFTSSTYCSTTQQLMHPVSAQMKNRSLKQLNFGGSIYLASTVGFIVPMRASFKLGPICS